MTHTVDSLMALADAYAEQMQRCGVGRLSQDNRATLCAALTEALAPKKPVPTGCTSNCENCAYAHGSPAHAGYCYMFYAEPQGVCAQWKDANPNIKSYPEKDISAQPARKQEFTGLPKRKLDDLLAQGYKISGVSFQREQDGATWRRGFITYGGMVGWWHGEHEQAQPVREPLTDGQIYTAYIEATDQTLRPQDERLALAFARAVERAHGIGGDK